jgi:hypothetical protein
MTGKPQKPEDALDRQLDAALAAYAAVEPRGGLEGRILASLGAQQKELPVRLWWQRVAIGATVTLIVILTLHFSWKTKKPELVKAPHPVVKENTVAASTTARFKPPLQHSTARRTLKKQGQISMIIPSNPPRLDQFPSPEPPSAQEEMLADYVTQFEEQAILIARFNEEDLRRNRLEFGVDLLPDSSGDFLNSDARVQ